jgi:hypothetical protein
MAMSDTHPIDAAPRVSVVTALFNPVHYLAGGAALGLGVALILLTAVIGYFGNAHVDGVLDFHVGRPAPLWLFLAEGAVNWLVLAVLLYAAGRLLSRSHHLRAIDVFGTQALARAPYLLAVLASLLPGFQRRNAAMIENLRRALGQNGAPSDVAPPGAESGPDLIVYLGVTIFGVLMLAWMVALMYRAYVSSCNLKGMRAIASFIGAVIFAEILSKLIIGGLFVVSSNAGA